MRRLILGALTLLICSGCSFSFDWLHMMRARRYVVAQNYPAAIAVFDKIIQNNPEGERSLQAARQGARLAHLEAKNYPLAVTFYRQIILQSSDAVERKSAQRFIAQIYFENLLEYDKAVQEYEKLLKLDHRPEEAFRYRLNLAKAHYQLNNWDQSLNEIDTILGEKIGPDEVFEAKLLKASVLLNRRKLSDAAELFESILKEFPDRSQKDNVALNLVVCYEDLKDFSKAIEVLERMKKDYPNPDFLDLRIARLKERRDNQPGAQGWKR